MQVNAPLVNAIKVTLQIIFIHIHRKKMFICLHSIGWSNSVGLHLIHLATGKSLATVMWTFYLSAPHCSHFVKACITLTQCVPWVLRKNSFIRWHHLYPYVCPHIPVSSRNSPYMCLMGNVLLLGEKLSQDYWLLS